MSPEEVALYSMIIAAASTSLTLIVKAVLKSNCVEVKCGPCIHCRREILDDIEQQKIELELSGDVASTSTKK